MKLGVVMVVAGVLASLAAVGACARQEVLPDPRSPAADAAAPDAASGGMTFLEAPAAPPVAPATSGASTAAADAGSNGTTVSTPMTDGGRKVVVTNAVDVGSTETTSSSSGPPSSPSAVIGTLRPKFSACYTDRLKKTAKLEGSVTLSAKIDKDGKVTAVTPKGLNGLDDVVMKCLTDRLKAASFPPSGSAGYTTSIDIPLAFASGG